MQASWFLCAKFKSFLPEENKLGAHTNINLISVQSEKEFIDPFVVNGYILARLLMKKFIKHQDFSQIKN